MHSALKFLHIKKCVTEATHKKRKLRVAKLTLYRKTFPYILPKWNLHFYQIQKVGFPKKGYNNPLV